MGVLKQEKKEAQIFTFHKVDSATKNLQLNQLENALNFQKELFEMRQKLPAYYHFKCVFERVAAAGLLVALSPVMLITAAAIYIRMGKPIIYRQLRVGEMGKCFWAYKFRTMRNNAPKVIEMGFKPLEKVVNDPRVEGRLGSFLRKWKWDELPQLWNVVKGDMNLIGPRPYLFEENLHFDLRFLARFAIRPGISGLWQAHNAEFNDPKLKARLDCYYVRKMSLLTDFWIWARTFYILSVGERL